MSFLTFIRNNKLSKAIVNFLKGISLPSYENVTLWDLIKMYVNGIQESALGNRASAISWRLLMSLFPFLLFFLIMLQYLPMFEVLEGYLYSEVIGNFLPEGVSSLAEDFLRFRLEENAVDFKESNKIVLILSTIAFLIFSTNGIQSLISGLNTYETLETRKRTNLQMFLVALCITFVLSILLIISLLTTYYTDVIGNILITENLEFVNQASVLKWLKYVVLIITFFISVLTVYYFGPKVQRSVKQLMPGTILTTILFLIISFLFGLYITKVARLNIIYGSLGSVLIVMIALYLNVILILLGYELNLALAKTQKNTQPNE